MHSALEIDHYGRNQSEGGQQTNNPMAAPSRASAVPSMASTGVYGQQYADAGGMPPRGPANPYDFNIDQTSLLSNSSGHRPTIIDDMPDAMVDRPIVVPPYSVTNSYQPGTLVGVSNQFSQNQQWTQTAPGPSNHPRFSGYASQLDTNLDQTMPSFEDALLTSAAPDRVVSGEHTDQLLQGPSLGLEFLSYGSQGPVALDAAQNEIPGTSTADIQAAPLQDPMGCSVESMAYTDRSGWWYSGQHDGWCRIPGEHRHDYDGGVHFLHYDSYTRNIYTEQNDHVTGYLLGLCRQLQDEQGDAMCLHRSCEEARRAAQQLVDAALPQDHGLRQAPLSQPHPVVIRLLQSLSDRLPEGYVYDPISQRVVQYNVPNLADPSIFRADPADSTDYAARDGAGEENSDLQIR